MELSIAKDLDKILNYLNSKAGHLFEILDELKIDKKNKELLFLELDSRKFIDVSRVIDGNHYININIYGKAFLQSSSFECLRSQNKKSVKKNRLAFIIDNSNKIISILAVVFGIGLGILNYSKDIKIDELNSEIKTLKQEKEQLQGNLSSKSTFKVIDNKTIHNLKH